MMTDRSEVHEAVRFELQLFARHLRETAVPRDTYDQWILDALSWYAGGGDD